MVGSETQTKRSQGACGKSMTSWAWMYMHHLLAMADQAYD